VLAKTIRIDGVKAGNGYERDQFEQAWSRYLPRNALPNRDTGTTRIVEPNSGETKPGQMSSCPGFEDGANPHGQRDVPVVPVSRTESRNGRAEGMEENGRIPLLGDPDYLDFVAARHSEGHLTTAEALEREQLHRRVEMGARERMRQRREQLAVWAADLDTDDEDDAA